MDAQAVNAWSTLVVAAATVVSVVVAGLLLAEQRANRTVAQVEAYPRLWGEAGMVLVLRLENYGPAPARIHVSPIAW